MIRTTTLQAALVGALLVVPVVAARQAAPPQAPAAGATLQVRLVDAEKKAAARAATVDVVVKGLRIVDPATVNEKPQPGEGHLHYQVDGGIVIATTATKLSFHELKPGDHVFSVTLAANDHAPLGAAQQVRVKVPGQSTN